MILHTYINIIIPNLIIFSQLCYNKILHKIIQDYSLILECYSTFPYYIRLPSKVIECYSALPYCIKLHSKII